MVTYLVISTAGRWGHLAPSLAVESGRQKLTDIRKIRENGKQWVRISPLEAFSGSHEYWTGQWPERWVVCDILRLQKGTYQSRVTDTWSVVPMNSLGIFGT